MLLGFGTEAAAIAGLGGGAGHDHDVVDPRRDTLPDATGQLELAVTQVDYTIVGSGADEEPVLHVFGRTADRELEHVQVTGFRPYFYTPTADLDDAKLANERITGQDSGYESIRGEALTKIFTQTPRDVGAIRDEFVHFEADILFPNRLLIDKDIRGGVRVPKRRAEDGSIVVHHDELESATVDTDPRVLTLDIEVDDRHGFPEDGEEPILCFTTHDSYDDEYVVWLYESPDGDGATPDSVSGYEFVREKAPVDVRTFDTEAGMLDALVEYVQAKDQDVLTGWNFEDFDIPYLLDRMEELDSGTDRDLSVERLSRVDEVWRSGWGGPDVKGRVVFDLLYAYKRTQFTELESYRLDAVGEMELDVGKERYPGDIGDLWEDDPERLLEYNLRDVELCVEINREQDVIPFWLEVASFVGCKLEDAPTPGDAVDVYVLHEAHGKFALPSKGQQEAEDFEGGAVFDPITGVRQNVSVLDLKSLYPMSMVTINASPETKVDPETYDGETYRTPNGVHFQKEPDGIIREMVDELLTEREEKKELRDRNDPDSEAYERYDRQQGAVKVIMNSLYGVFGWDRFRLYDRAMSSGVTATNRDVIRYTQESVNDLGYQVVYGDTDSVMIEVGDDSSKEEVIDLSFELEERINDSYDKFAREVLNAEEHRFQIEFEKLYRRFFQAGKKKRYAGHIVWKEGKDVDDIDITGFEYKRSDIAPITKEVQRQVIEMIVTGEDLDDVKEYVSGVIKEFEAGDVNLDQIGIPGGIGKRLGSYETDTAQVRGAKYANLLLGTNFGRGSKPKRLYLEKHGLHPDYVERIGAERPEITDDPLFEAFKRDVSTGDGVICYEFADQVPAEFAVDYEKMLEKTLKGPIARVLEALDISWEEVRSGQKQAGLGEFM
jgi:DNA polymerase elongation subunit (family B)